MDFERFLHWFEMFKSRFRTEKFFSGIESVEITVFKTSCKPDGNGKKNVFKLRDYEE